MAEHTVGLIERLVSPPPLIMLLRFLGFRWICRISKNIPR